MVAVKNYSDLNIELLGQLWTGWKRQITNPIDESEAEILIELLYKECGFKKPEIIYFSNPFSLVLGLYIKKLREYDKNTLRECVLSEDIYLKDYFDEARKSLLKQSHLIPAKTAEPITSTINQFVNIKFNNYISRVINKELTPKTLQHLRPEFDEFSKNRVYLNIRRYFIELLTYNYLNSDKFKSDGSKRASMYIQVGEIISILNQIVDLYNNDNHFYYLFFKLNDLKIQKDLLDLLTRIHYELLWILPCKDVCFVSQKPSKFYDYNDIENTSISPVLEFNDSCNIWITGGVRLTNIKYHCHSFLWKPQWLLEEENTEIRRVLLEGIGPHRLLSELNANLIDTFESSQQGLYKLYKLNDSIDFEDYMILKMQCPSTDLSYVTRVPPNMKSAREAITWINNGVDPETFVIAS